MTRSLTCTDCGLGTLHPATWESDFRHGDATLRVRELECHRCDSCGSDPVFPDQIRRNQLRIADAKRTHDGMLTGAGIRSVREHLGVTQAEAAELFGGGANAFSKYERGDVIQSVAMDRLLKVADFVPGVIDFLRIEAGLASRAEWRSIGDAQTVATARAPVRPQVAGLRGQGTIVARVAYSERRRA